MSSELFQIKHDKTQLKIRYSITTKDGETQIRYFLKSQGVSISENSILNELFFEYESNLIEFSKIIVSKLERFKQIIIDKHSKRSEDKDEPKRYEKSQAESEKFLIDTNMEPRIFSLRKDLNMLQSFKKRKIITYFDEKPVALTTISIFGDQKTLLDTNSARSLLRFHSINVRFSEFLIAGRLRAFMNILQKLAEILSICVGFVIGASLFYNFEIAVPRHDTIDVILWKAAVEFGVPNTVMTLGRKIIGGWITRRILKFALGQIIKRLGISNKVK